MRTNLSSSLAFSPFSRLLAASTLSLLALASTGSLSAQVVLAPTTPQVGSSNPATAEPLVTRPRTKPCIVTLLTNQSFIGFTPPVLNYTPPAACPGPWAKVVFTADFTVTAGRQFDRTAEFYLGNANIFYGTTAEPRSKLSPSWHVERDLTDLSALFKSPQTGTAEIGNVVDSTYTGIIYGNAQLEFYPASLFAPAPAVPDLVVPVSGTNDAATLSTTTSQVTQILNLPRNVEKVYLDVIAQSQSNDEFWYFCVPSDQSTALESCGNTPFRETQITIDGKPAGVAPVYPWIYTGGIDPYLWEPITGVQTLNFKPYRVDLTPFAGLLADGSQHTIGVSVYNANGYFLATANLLVYTDHFRRQVNGGLITNTLGLAPTPVVTESLVTDTTGTTTGTVSTGSHRKFTLRGWVDTSHGRVETTVEQTVNFLNVGTFNVGATVDLQNVAQTSTVDSVTSTQDGFLIATDEKHISFPLTLDYSYVVNSDGTQTQVVTSNQKDLLTQIKGLNGFSLYKLKTEEEVNTTDTLQFNTSGALTAAGTGSATATYKTSDTLGNCSSRTVTSTNQAVTAVTDGKACNVR